MGKSLGNVLDPAELLERCGQRGSLVPASGHPFGEDGDFQQQRFGDLVNNDLANTIGNLLNRTNSMARRWFDETVPPAKEAKGNEHPIAQAAAEAKATSLAALENLDSATLQKQRFSSDCANGSS